MARGERRLLHLGKVVEGVAVQHHLANFLQGVVLVGPDLQEDAIVGARHCIVCVCVCVYVCVHNRAAPLVRVRVKFMVKNPVCNGKSVNFHVS